MVDVDKIAIYGLSTYVQNNITVWWHAGAHKQRPSHNRRLYISITRTRDVILVSFVSQHEYSIHLAVVSYPPTPILAPYLTPHRDDLNNAHNRLRSIPLLLKAHQFRVSANPDYYENFGSAAGGDSRADK